MAPMVKRFCYRIFDISSSWFEQAKEAVGRLGRVYYSHEEAYWGSALWFLLGNGDDVLARLRKRYHFLFESEWRNYGNA